MEFHPPKLKHFALNELESDCQYPASLKNVSLCSGNRVVGKYNGSNVVVNDVNFVHTIFSLGCFGKGSLSRGEPTYMKRKALHKDTADSDLKTSGNIHKDTGDDDLETSENIPKDTMDCDLETSENIHKDNDTSFTSSVDKRSEESDNKEKDSNQEKVNQESLKDIAGESCKGKNIGLKVDLQESLYLNLEEAYFLSYSLGCLGIVDLFDKELSLLDSWRLFCESQEDFVQKYVAYHYYRSKGWVVKPGLKFGGDFVLYKFGPHITHATYIVLIEVIKEDGNVSEEHQPSITWGRFISLNRMAESAGKEVILCRIVWPNDTLFNDVQSPEELRKFKVIEVLTRRWVSSQEREEN